MMKNIFDLMNQVETNFEKYEILELSQPEKEESTARILCKLKEQDIQNNPDADLGSAGFIDSKKFMGAAALFLVCLLSVGGVAYAMTDGFRALFTFIGGGAIYETTESSNMGTTDVTVVTMQDKWGIPLLLQDGRLYFTGDGGKTDITDFVSETEPYFIDVVDEEGNTHKFIVGGSPEEGYYGYSEMIIDTEGVLRGGTGNWSSKSGDRPEWLKKGTNAVYSEVYGTSVELW